MKLNELATKRKGKQIRIGTQRGSSFVWMGTVDDSFLEEMDKLTEYYLANYKTKLAKTKEALAKEVEYWEMYLTDILPKTKEGLKNGGSLGTVPEACAIKPFVRCSSIYNGMLVAVNNLIGNPFADREIVEFYPSLKDKDITIYIVKGRESGYAWDEDEWKGIGKGDLIEEEDEDASLLE